MNEDDLIRAAMNAIFEMASSCGMYATYHHEAEGDGHDTVMIRCDLEGDNTVTCRAIDWAILVSTNDERELLSFSTVDDPAVAVEVIALARGLLTYY